MPDYAAWNPRNGSDRTWMLPCHIALILGRAGLDGNASYHQKVCK